MIAKNTSGMLLKLFGLIACFIGVGFLSIYHFNLRKTGIETNGKLIWWNEIRPIHGIIWLLFGLCAIFGVNVWWLLLIDVIIGLLAYTFIKPITPV